MTTLNKLCKFSNQEKLTQNQEKLNELLAVTKSNITYPFVDTNTLVGIEVEVEHIHKKYSLLQLERDYLWTNIEDGSLRNNGREFVSCPIKGNQISFAIHSLFSTFRRDKKCVGYEFSERTSIHVHINYQEETMETLLNSILIYLLVEPLLYAFVGGLREENIFCIPIQDSNYEEILYKAFGSFEGEDEKGCLSHLRNWSKYSGLNLLPLFKYGTLEFRHLLGTDDKELIFNWINIILCIKKYAAKSSYKEIKKTLIDMNSSSIYIGFINSIFNGILPYHNIPNVEKVLEKSVNFIKEIYSSDDSYKYFLFNKRENSDPTLFFYEVCLKQDLLYKSKNEVKRKPVNWLEEIPEANLRALLNNRPLQRPGVVLPQAGQGENLIARHIQILGQEEEADF